MTHIAWVPPQWLGAAEETLAGMAERHPSRTLLLVPHPDEPDGIDAQLSIRCFPVGDRAVCGEVIELALRGRRSSAPASIVLPLLVSDLPVFCRWRGEPPFGEPQFEQLVEIVDRLVVDSARVGRARLEELAGDVRPDGGLGHRLGADAAWRVPSSRGYWPAIREQEIHVRGPRAEATLLRAWLAARLGRAIRAVEAAEELGVRLGGEELPPPRERRPDAERPAERRARPLRPRPDLRGGGRAAAAASRRSDTRLAQAARFERCQAPFEVRYGTVLSARCQTPT